MDSIEVEIIRSKDTVKYENDMNKYFRNIIKLKVAYKILMSFDLNYFNDDEVADYIVLTENLSSLYEVKEENFINNIKELYNKLEYTEGVPTPDEIINLIEKI